MLVSHHGRNNNEDRRTVITPVTIVSAISVTLIASLFTHRKLDVAWCGISAFISAYLAAPTITISPHAYFGEYGLQGFLRYDLAIDIGIACGLGISILLSKRYENSPSFWMAIVSFLVSGTIGVLYFGVAALGLLG